MKYQIIHEDDKHFKLHDVKTNKHFVVAKKGLSKEFIEKAQKLCGGGAVRMSEGGEVPSSLAIDPPDALPQDVAAVPKGIPSGLDASNPEPSSYISRDPSELMKVPGLTIEPKDGDGMAPLQQATSSEMPIQVGSQTTASQSIPDKDSGYLDKAISTEKNSLLGIASAKQNESKTNEKTLSNLATQQVDAYQQLQNAHADVEKENAPLREQILNTKVDPNRLWNNASTGNKVLASIGLILGGIGSGLTKSPNAALDVMQKNIDRDIQSQRDDLGKKQTLYSMNMERYKNADAAYAATMLNYGTVAKTMIEQSAAKSGSQQAMLQAQAAGAQIDLSMAPLKQKLALEKISMQNADPVGRQVRLLVPEKEQPAVYSEIEKSQNAVKIKDSLMKEFNKADSENTLMGRAMHLGFSPQSIANMKAMVVPLLKDEAGRVTEPELERVDGFLPSPGDSRAKIEEKRKGLMEFITAKEATPRASSYGIRPAGEGQYNSQGKSRFTEGKPKL